MVTETVILPNFFCVSWKKVMGLVEFMFMGEVYLQFKYGIIYMVPTVVKYMLIVKLCFPKMANN